MKTRVVQVKVMEAIMKLRNNKQTEQKTTVTDIGQTIGLPKKTVLYDEEPSNGPHLSISS